VHTFFKLVPAEKYAKEHPEYYALIDGKRIPSTDTYTGQLCLTNPDVLRISNPDGDEVDRRTAERKIFSVSANDIHKGCECEKCKSY